MKIVNFIFVALSAIGSPACGQSTVQNTEITQKNNIMDTSKLTNETVKKAFNAWQSGDGKTFLSFFTVDARLYDDGNPRNLQDFVKNACGHEKFTNIEKVGNDGKEIIGNFHTESWGDFRTYFKFKINEDGKFNRLDIGQAQ